MSKKFLALLLIIFSAAFLAALAKPSSAGWLDFLYAKRDFLTVRGNGVFLNGKSAVKLHGVAMGSPYLRQAKSYRDTSDYEIVKSWQANIVRLSVHPGVYKKNEKEIKKALKEEVAAARSNGLFVIIDWHVIGFPNGNYMSWPQGPYRDIYYDSKMQLAEDFWKYAATEYRDDRGVIFELWNEPSDTQKPTFPWNEIQPYIKRLYDVVRSRGAKNIVLAPGTFWSYDFRGIKKNPLKGSDIGYAWHNYPSKDNYVSWDRAMDGLNSQYPIFVTEWGYSTELKGQHYSLTAADRNYPEQFKSYMVNNNLNSTAWAWHSGWQPRMLNEDWQTPNDFGRFVKTFLSDMRQGRLIAKPKKVTAAPVADIPSGLTMAYQSYSQAFNKKPVSVSELNDVSRIGNGLEPLKRSQASELRAKTVFKKVYTRQPHLDNASDKRAVMIMAYGIRQKKENVNVAKEKFAMAVFQKTYGREPLSIWEQGVVQAIAYSGAKK